MFEHSPRLTLPYIQPAQAQKHVTHNQAIRQIDGLIHMSVVSDALSTPPTEQAEGTCYLVPPNAQNRLAALCFGSEKTDGLSRFRLGPFGRCQSASLS